jgi:hypothetical protein
MASTNNPSTDGTLPPFITGLCLLGCFLYMALPQPLLNNSAIHSANGVNFVLQKIHPGTIPVFISFLALLMRAGNPYRGLLDIRRDMPASLLLLAVTVLIFAYALARSGAHGTGFLLDTHMAAPLIAIVAGYSRPALLRKAAVFMIGFAALDSVIGIGEFVTHLRVYSFDPDWAVLHEKFFRASSLMGQPLASALLLPSALFAALSLDLSRPIKTGLIILMPVALIAFGSYCALAVTILSLGALGAVLVMRDIKARRLTMPHATLMAGLFVCGVTALVVEIMACPDQRAAAGAEYQYILSSQHLAFSILASLNMRDVLFGISSDRIAKLAAGVGIRIPASDINNPWILLFLMTGGGAFLLWLVATANFWRALLRWQPFALTCAVLAYFIIASTSNSFGRKDTIYPAMTGLVAYAAGAKKTGKSV